MVPSGAAHRRPGLLLPLVLCLLFVPSNGYSYDDLTGENERYYNKQKKRQKGRNKMEKWATTFGGAATDYAGANGAGSFAAGVYQTYRDNREDDDFDRTRNYKSEYNQGGWWD